MFENNKILVVIPASGGSKDIPRKNVRILGEQPLISYSIKTAKNSKYVDDVVVSTDDDEIKFISEKFGATVVRRSTDLTGEDVPLDSVIYDALLQKEKLVFDEYEIVITLQPTSPILKTETLDLAIEKFSSTDVDSVVSVVEDDHLSWKLDENTNRYYKQPLTKEFRETNAILATKRTFLSENSRLGNNIDLIKLSYPEAIDINKREDWWTAERYVNKRRIVFKVDAFNKIGTGHIYRCMSMASKLLYHDILFVLNKKHELGIDILKKYDIPFVLHGNDKDLYKKIDEFKPDVVINDILNTSLDYISTLKSKGYFVVNFQDLGKGAEVADLVFDPFEESNLNDRNVFKGAMFYILKEEFFFQQPKIITQDVKNVLLTFGGVDNNNFTEKVLDAIIDSGYSKQIHVILGPGYSNKKDIEEKYKTHLNISIFSNINNISDFMVSADIIFTSAGMTMYEVCSLGVPCICLCQDELELSRTFGNSSNGFINMGLGNNLSKEDISNQFIKLVNDFNLRKEMNKKMLSINLKYGFDSVWSIMRPSYRNFTFQNRFKT
ncbi:MAG: UDP-2,4-diacetamido-2,4,6-trideoxy-beta-L-altropyranose hydrolase [Methanobacteriaceae archaeon]|jgi:CMP-N-acetylneuraminic acid synthetase|nr:UDP-2,4-diacetamido-2,4,6-trideoxy-beta-L-altropyranose hydrolase [Methanobacteriaceae archaeon]